MDNALALSQVDGSLCTHLVLAWAQIDSQANLVMANKEQAKYFEAAADFKRQNPQVRLMVSVRNEPSELLSGQQNQPHLNGFQRLASSQELRQRFARSAIEFLVRYKLDGLDLDWQFPNFPTNLLGTREHERLGLTKIIGSLRSAIVENFYARQTAAQQHELQSSRLTTTSFHRHQCNGVSAGSLQQQVEPHLLTATIAGQESVLRASYELRQMANLCDWLHVLTYDYFLFKAYAPFTGPNAPLEPIVDGYVPILSKLAFTWTLQRLLEEGVDRSKIVLGIPTYGRAYRLAFRSSQPAPFTLAVGTRAGRDSPDCLGYGEILEILARADTRVEFDERARVPYLLTDGGYTWITYENARSVREKVRFIKKQQLAGYMTWNLNNDHHQDDVQAKANGAVGQQAETETITSGSASFPLHRAMLEELSMDFADST